MTAGGPEWALFDYGVGNLHSLHKALERAGARATVTDDPMQLVEADVAVLPGVGAFGHVMAALGPAAAGLRERHQEGRPIVGVCIGQQVLHEGSIEAPGVAGLGILPGQVERIPASAGKVPHMGWNTVAHAEDAADGPFAGVPEGGHFYYVHSFAAPVSPFAIATTDYGGAFAAAEQRGNTLGFQFHPEKSGPLGAQVLRNTVRWANTLVEAA
ncbi:MAG: imidazole glycerol phosphate synthase subunit HisH [Thermoplasmatota archaeon]